MKKILFYLLFFSWLGCNTAPRANQIHFTKIGGAVPNGVFITKNLQVDKSEISNIDWKEYLYWTERIFGKESEMYKHALPDTTVWELTAEPFQNLVSPYLRHPSYDKMPVVGISQAQAEQFGKWRSDRVFQAMLVQHGYIKLHADDYGDKHFTIEKYLAGKYRHYKPHKKVKAYPVFTLPTAAERDTILDYYQQHKVVGNETIISEETQSMLTSTYDSPVMASYPTDEKKNKIYHVKGNVAEWGKEKNTAYGGSWMEPESEILKTDKQTATKPTAGIGVRYVCRWKKIDNLN